ncbi:MAG TPA: winged helix-turn-helix domain-containing protein [Ktedonobacterales bacterium]|nr:winged helix-turn-helix domain-containing protein [Ktedonobacterales bacterium]
MGTRTEPQAESAVSPATRGVSRVETRPEPKAEPRTASVSGSGANPGASGEARPDPRLSAPRAVDLRRGRAPEVEIIACPTYDFLLSVHVSLASPDDAYADYDVGRAWIESARARCAARDPQALATLGRYLGDGRPGSLHATLISLVWQCPEPRDPAHFLAWLPTLPAAQFAEALLDQEGLSLDWVSVLQAALAERANRGTTGSTDEVTSPALERLLESYALDVRPTVYATLDNLEGARAELIGALRVWLDTVFAAETPRLEPLLAREAAAMEQRRRELALEPFIELAMRGVQVSRPAGLRRIIFAPSYFCRPAVYYHFWRGTLTFCAPIEFSSRDAESSWADPRAPGDEILRFFEALGDSTRLRILRLLADREMYLTELAERLGLTKATTKHHMVRLRAAGFVTLYDRDRLTYYALRPDVARRAAQMLDAYLGRPRQPGITGAARDEQTALPLV